MVERARKMSAEDLSGRLPVANPRDELGRLAETVNDLLSRLEASITAQRQLMGAQRQFMADASHELRTPVATTRTAANVALQQPHRGEPEYRDALALIEQQAARLSRIVDDMFTLARADAGTYPLRQMPMYVDEVVEEVVKGARVLASTRDVSIDAATIPSATFTGDEELIRRLLVNLLDNAIRYAPAGSRVRVDLAQAPGGIALSITDHGPGIPVDVQPHIFERFYRADAARARREGSEGAGLGLALARWIAEAHGGRLTLARSSEAGTTFTAFLPTAS
jgi:signal transduction histidine kinase